MDIGAFTPYLPPTQSRVTPSAPSPAEVSTPQQPGDRVTLSNDENDPHHGDDAAHSIVHAFRGYQPVAGQASGTDKPQPPTTASQAPGAKAPGGQQSAAASPESAPVTGPGSSNTPQGADGKQPAAKPQGSGVPGTRHLSSEPSKGKGEEGGNPLETTSAFGHAVHKVHSAIDKVGDAVEEAGKKAEEAARKAEGAVEGIGGKVEGAARTVEAATEGAGSKVEGAARTVERSTAGFGSKVQGAARQLASGVSNPLFKKTMDGVGKGLLPPNALEVGLKTHQGMQELNNGKPIAGALDLGTAAGTAAGTTAATAKVAQATGKAVVLARGLNQALPATTPQEVARLFAATRGPAAATSIGAGVTDEGAQAARTLASAAPAVGPLGRFAGAAVPVLGTGFAAAGVFSGMKEALTSKPGDIGHIGQGLFEAAGSAMMGSRFTPLMLTGMGMYGMGMITPTYVNGVAKVFNQKNDPEAISPFAGAME
ncbi:MAG: hypothetical protein ACYCW6_19285 [Candidatus Xenobia bacterium]